MRAGRLAIILLGLALIIAGAVYVLRMPVAGVFVRGAMANAGLENPGARVTALSLGHIALADISAGPSGAETLEVDDAEARFDWRSLLSERRVDALKIGPGSVSITVSEDGKIVAPGYGGGAGSGSGELPFGAFEIQELALIIETPAGVADGSLIANFTKKDGGVAELSVETQRAGIEGSRFEEAKIEAELSLNANGQVQYAANFSGDIVTDASTLKDVQLVAVGAGNSWRMDLRDFSGEAHVELKSATAVVENAPVLSTLNADQAALLFGAPVSLLEAAGGATVSFGKDEIAVSLEEAPLTLRADSGATLILEPHGDDVAFRHDGDRSEANFAFSVQGGGISVLGMVNGEAAGENWSVIAPVQIGAYRAGRVAMKETSAIIRAEGREGGILADITTTTTLQTLSIGRLTVKNAPFSANLLVDIDAADKRVTVSLPAEHCLTLDRGDFFLSQQNMDAALSAAQLCQSTGQLAQIDWENGARVEFAGALAAKSGHYRLGRTRFAGRPPVIDFAGTYQPAENRTDMRGAISDGRIMLNEWLTFTKADGEFELTLDREHLKIEGEFDRLRIAQPETAPRIAPVIATGNAVLDRGDADFNYVLLTPKGVRLGEGEGVHNVGSAVGNSTLRFDDIAFERGGLQPNQLAPVLKGVVAQAVGAADGEVLFRWAPESGVRTSAKAQLENIDFAGPTRIVTQTFGLNADLEFATLWPVSTDGPQTVTVEGVDFGALQLARGEIVFEMPGDRTLQVERAEFPWFGGVLGVYEASASMADGTSTSPLRAEKIDLGQVLEFVDVDGLSGEGILSGVLPLIVEDGKARIENGVLRAEGPGALRYVGGATESAEQTGEQARVAFDLLRDLRYNTLHIELNGPLDGRVQFDIRLEGTGEITTQDQKVRVPVNYNINLEAALLELFRQANLARNFELQIQRAIQGER